MSLASENRERMSVIFPPGRLAQLPRPSVLASSLAVSSLPNAGVNFTLPLLLLTDFNCREHPLKRGELALLGSGSPRVPHAVQGMEHHLLLARQPQLLMI